MKQDLAAEAMKAAPPVAVVTANTVAGMTLNDYVALATIAYVVLQAAYLCWKWYKEHKASK